MKNRRLITRSVSIVLCFAALAIPAAAAKAKSWKAGRVISTGLHGYGINPKGNFATLHSQDVWWSYCISSGDRTFTALSREKPSKSGLIENVEIKLLEKRNEIIVLNPSGSQITLKLLRKGRGQECP